ncbi:MAG: class I SAM-dependent DNA methyltransferase [Candidatus Binatia bacterium]
MPAVFVSDIQEKLYRQVVLNLEKLGYKDELLPQPYSFVDWFLPGTPEKVIPAAAFGCTPQSYDSACFAILIANGKSGADLVHDCRALGAPLAFEIRPEALTLWRVGREPNASVEHQYILPKDVERVFREHKDEWSYHGILRLKNAHFQPPPRQLDFIDLGLIPALEREISTKLNALLSEVIAEATKVYKRNTSHQPNEQELFRLVFRFLAAKVLRDRGAPQFRSLSDAPDVKKVLSDIDHYYGQQGPVLQDQETQTVIARNLWSRVDFRNLSVEVLAYIYEHTLVDKATRKEMSIHSTPHSVARYIVHRLPFEKLAESERRVVEPFAGHAIFLVAALQRLRELLPSDMNATERHRYFVRMLQGFELDPFAREVATLCLMLADFPNHNGWRIYPEDVFVSEKFLSSLRKARIVLSNPPFEDFTFSEREKYQERRSVLQPVEFLHRVLKHLPAQGMLGVVLPRQFIDGKSYQEIRRLLAQRFQAIEVVALPDRVFRISQVESALLIATEPSFTTRTHVTISYTEVADKDRERFLTEYRCTRRESQAKTTAEAEESFVIIALREIWDRLSHYPRLGEVAEIHRGIEWQSPFDPGKYLSPTKKPGFERGLNSAAGNFWCFQTPPSEYLSIKPEDRRRNAFDLPWDKPKVILNAARVSRGPWKIAAFPEETGLVCTKNFHALWLRDPHWTIKSLTTVLNAPIAGAFVAVHVNDKHIPKHVLQNIPLPRLGATEIEALDRAVDHYLRLIANLPAAGSLFTKDSSSSVERARQALLRIDALVLKAYNLPPRLERQLLDFFRGAQRSVPFPFTEYFPESFRPTLPLWMYISPEYEKCRVDFFLRNAPQITDLDLIEALQEVE